MTRRWTSEIPWWGKVAAKLALSRLPLAYSTWQKLKLFRHGYMDDAHYALRVFESHAQRTSAISLSGATILELGPGDSIATAVIAAAKGARAVLVDAGPFARPEIEIYQQLADILKAGGDAPPDCLIHCKDMGAVLACTRAEYLTHGLDSLRSIPTASVDLIFSQAVLEHIRRGEFLDTMRECYRVLKPGGVCSHRVDLKDHLQAGLNNLRFSEQLWESPMFVEAGFYTNRIQCGEMLQPFKAAGFESELTGVTRWSELPTPRRAMASAFRSLPDSELLISGFDVLLRRPPNR